MKTQRLLEGSGINGCLHELKELVFFYLTYPFVFVRVLIKLFMSYTQQIYFITLYH